jgi:hypothetical protein
MTTFGPQLIGETEKTLNAILIRLLADAGLTEREWVTLRLAGQNSARADLAALVADRAHFPDAADVVAALRERGLLDGDAPSDEGRALLARTGERIASTTAPVWAGLPADDVAATQRTLEEVVARARMLLQA